MALIRFNGVSVSFGGPFLLDDASLQIEHGERIGLLGRNGSGKSTLMRLLTGDVMPDSGVIAESGGRRIGMLPQDVPESLPGTIYDVVAAGGSENLALLHEYHTLAVSLSQGQDEGVMKRFDYIQRLLEASGGWRYHQRVEEVLSRTGLDGNGVFEVLSAGMKRRVFLARALVNDPDLLLLDEPTNHLDIRSILWLEEFLLNFDKAVLFVTHDRTFLQRVATRIVEIDRGRLISFGCRYGVYLERRQAMLDAEENQAREFDRKLAREEEWIRQGIKARRTRNEGRVRALMELRKRRSERRDMAGDVRLSLQEATRSGKLVIEANKIDFSYGETKIVGNFSTTILRGDKVGIIGPNGAGKTTLLKILLGELPPDGGSIRMGTGIQVAYFDQLRACLDENRTLKDTVADGNDTVIVGGRPRHIVGYLQDFLFPPDRLLSPVSSLSGGERNRLLLAKLFVLPSNLLVLDEPTNDLDMETLDLLEERLFEYRGTIILVSHDRSFLNNVVTSTIVFEGDGHLQEYVGGYDDWLRQAARPDAVTVLQDASVTSVREEARPKRERAPREKQKLSYRERQELELLPKKLEALEKEREELHATINSPAFYSDRDHDRIIRTNERLKAVEKELEEGYLRWDELEGLAERFGEAQP